MNAYALSLSVFFSSASILSCDPGNTSGSLNQEESLNSHQLAQLTNDEITTPPDALRIESSLNHDYFMGNPESREGYLYIEINAPKVVPEENSRIPLNVSIVIDRSGSMQGDKLKYVKEAAKFLIDHLSPEDLVSIVTYETEVETVLPSQKIENKEQIKRKIDGIYTAGSTNLSGGMLAGYSQVKSTYQTGYVNRVLLLSDGLANQGITDMTELQKIAGLKNQEDGITLSTFGVGADFNEDLMLNLAEYGSGNYYFIEQPDMIPQIFSKELSGLLSVVAQNAILNVKLPASVEVKAVYGYEFQKTINGVSVNFMDLFSEEKKAVLIAFKIVKDENQPLTFRSALTFDDVLNQYEHRTIGSENKMTRTDSENEYLESFNKEVEQQVTLFLSNERLEEAMKLVDQGKYEEARKTVDDNEAYLKNRHSEWDANEETTRQDSINTAYKEQIKDVEKMNAHDRKMMQKSNKSQNYYSKKKKK